MRVLKLHGSLNWSWIQNTEEVIRLPIAALRDATPSQKSSAFLYPAYEKDVVGRRIYGDLFMLLDELMERTTRWAFVGFSFRDQWLRYAFDARFRRAKPDDVVVISPSLTAEDLPIGLRSASIVSEQLEALRDDFSPVEEAIRGTRERARMLRMEARVSVAASIGMKVDRPGLVAYWRLTEESVDAGRRVALDIGPRALDGAIVGAVLGSERRLYFDGVKALVDVGVHESLILGDALSVIARARSESTETDQVILASQGETDVDFAFGIAPDRRLFLQVTASGEVYDTAYSTTEVDSGDHFVGASARWGNVAPSLVVEFYVDGEVRGRATPWVGATIAPLRPMTDQKLPMQVTIGGSLPGSDLYRGSLSDVQLFDEYLDSTRMRSLHGASGQ